MTRLLIGWIELGFVAFDETTQKWLPFFDNRSDSPFNLKNDTSELSELTSCKFFIYWVTLYNLFPKDLSFLKVCMRLIFLFLRRWELEFKLVLSLITTIWQKENNYYIARKDRFHVSARSTLPRATGNWWVGDD